MGFQGSEKALSDSDTAPRLPHCAGVAFSVSIFSYHMGLSFEPRDRITDLENKKLEFKNHQGQTRMCTQPRQLPQTKRSQAPAENVRLAVPTDFLLDLTSTFRLSRPAFKASGNQAPPGSSQPGLPTGHLKPQGPRGRTQPLPLGGPQPRTWPGCLHHLPPTSFRFQPHCHWRGPPQPPSPKQLPAPRPASSLLTAPSATWHS